MTFSKEIIGRRGIIYGGSLLFFLCIAAFMLTQRYLVLAVPFVVAVLVLAILNLKTFYWFFLLTIPLSSTIYFFHDTLSTTVPDEPLAWVLLAISILILAYNRKMFKEWFFRNPITLIIVLQLIWVILAVIFSQDIFLSIKYAASRLWFINAYFFFPILIFKSPKDFKKAFLLLAIPVTLHALFAFGWHYTLDFDYQCSNKVVHPFYFNHVDYSTTLSMLFPLLCVSWKLSKGKIWLRWITGLAVLFYIPAILAAQARAAMLAVIFAFFIAFMIRKKWVNIVMPLGYIFILAGVFYLAHNNYYLKLRPTTHTATQPTLEDAIIGTFTGRDMSSMERLYRWVAAIRMSKERPVIGVGPNNFYYYYKPHTVSMMATWVSRNKEHSTTHNYFLYMLVEQGYPAMILYGLLIMLVFARAQKIYHETDHPFYKITALGLAMAFAAGFVNNFFSELIETHKVGALFYLAIAGIVIIEHLAKKEKQKELR